MLHGILVRSSWNLWIANEIGKAKEHSKKCNEETVPIFIECDSLASRRNIDEFKATIHSHAHHTYTLLWAHFGPGWTHISFWAVVSPIRTRLSTTTQPCDDCMLVSQHLETRWDDRCGWCNGTCSRQMLHQSQFFRYKLTYNLLICYQLGSVRHADPHDVWRYARLYTP